MIGGLILRAVLAALLDSRFLTAVERLVTAAVGKKTDDQTAIIRAELSAVEGRLSAEITDVSVRLEALSGRVAVLEAAAGGPELEVPPPPPFPPGGNP